MPDIGVVTALPREAATLGVAPPRSGDDALFNGLRVAVSGVGAQPAEVVARRLLKAGVAALVSWGVGGGLAPDLQPGDVVIADRVGWTSGDVAVDAAWAARLADAMREAGVAATAGPLWSHVNVVTSIAEKQQLAERGYIAVDMESIGVARAAQAAGVPFVAVKGVSDPALRALPDSAIQWLRPDGRVRPGALAVALARKPRLWRVLHTMQKDFNAACAGLRGGAGALPASWPP